MTKSEFAQLLQRFAVQPTPATVAERHLYLWTDDLDPLVAIAPAGICAYLDMGDLAAILVRRPNAIDEARKVLQGAIQLWLHDHRVQMEQQVVIVTGVWLLARYKPSLHALVQTASDRCMVVFVAPHAETGFTPMRALPPYIAIRPVSLLEYVQATLNLIIVEGNRRA